MATQPKSRLTPEEYLARERLAEQKSEYFAGEVFAMAGATRAHNLIVINTAGELRQHLKGKPCEVYASDMRLKVAPSGLYTYPDVTVVCGQPMFEDQHADTLLNPTVVIEVLSASTEAYDRGKKFEHYRRIPSLRSYALIAQDRIHIEVFSRSDPGFWTLADVNDRDGVVDLSAIGCAVPVAEIYHRLVLVEPKAE